MALPCWPVCRQMPRNRNPQDSTRCRVQDAGGAPRPVVLTLMGPTAAGKTAAALRLAERGNMAIISVDSAMVYRRMDIGTAKPDAATLARHPHALVDIREPWESYSAARFVADADAAVRDAFAAGRTPLLVGGTMLYFRAFKHGIDQLPPANAAVRQRIAARAAAQGWPRLHQELALRDPDAAARIDPRNGQRIARALEVCETTGAPMSALWAKTAVPANERLACRLVECAIVPTHRQALHTRIEQRVCAMIQQGFVEEVAALRAIPALSLATPSMRAVGYRQIWRHLDGEYDRAEMLARVQAATRQLAKRQLTWLRGWRDLALQAADAEALDASVARVLEQPLSTP